MAVSFESNVEMLHLKKTKYSILLCSTSMLVLLLLFANMIHSAPTSFFFGEPPEYVIMGILFISISGLSYILGGNLDEKIHSKRVYSYINNTLSDGIVTTTYNQLFYRADYCKHEVMINEKIYEVYQKQGSFTNHIFIGKSLKDEDIEKLSIMVQAFEQLERAKSFISGDYDVNRIKQVSYNSDAKVAKLLFNNQDVLILNFQKETDHFVIENKKFNKKINDGLL